MPKSVEGTQTLSTKNHAVHCQFLNLNEEARITRPEKSISFEVYRGMINLPNPIREDFSLISSIEV